MFSFCLAGCATGAPDVVSSAPTRRAPLPAPVTSPFDVPFTRQLWQIGGSGTLGVDQLVFDVGCTAPDNSAVAQLPDLSRSRWRVDVDGSESCPGSTVMWMVALDHTDPDKRRVLGGWMLDGSEGEPVFDATTLGGGESVALVFRVSGGSIHCGATVLKKVRLVPLAE